MLMDFLRLKRMKAVNFFLKFGYFSFIDKQKGELIKQIYNGNRLHTWYIYASFYTVSIAVSRISVSIFCDHNICLGHQQRLGHSLFLLVTGATPIFSAAIYRSTFFSDDHTILIALFQWFLS